MLVDEKIDVGGTDLSGRIAFPPMATGSCSDGRAGQRLVEHYCGIARNPNVSLIVFEHAFVHQSGRADPGQLSLSRDEDVPSLHGVVDAVHAARSDIRVFAQINHAGVHARPVNANMPLLSPTQVGDTVKGLSTAEIHIVVRWFADAARRAKDAGFDGVEIHAAHAYLLCEFFSPLTNHRKDEYGPQSVENRMRIHTETIAATREAVGEGYPISLRLGASDYQRGGSTIEDGVRAATLAERAGADLISVSGGLNIYTRPGHREPGYFFDASSAIKAAVSVPVLLTGGVTTRDEAEELLRRSGADIIGVGRALYRNPLWEM